MYSKVNIYEKEFEITRIVIEKYANNGNLALQIMCIDDETGWEDYFAKLTVNLTEYTLNENEAFVDTNNCPWAEKFIEENNIGKFQNIYAPSGYCHYPQYKFDIERIEELNEQKK